jgi:hypothetical protein
MSYLRHPEETDADYAARVKALYAGSSVGNDPAQPIWDADKFQTPPSDDPALSAAVVMRSLEVCAAVWTPGGPRPDSTRLDVALALAKILPVTGLAPKDPAPGAEDFVWARARCVFAGFGFDTHGPVCTILSSLFHHFPWSADETQADWDKYLLQAHKDSGFPATVAWLDWKTLRKLPEMPPDSLIPDWLLWKAWTHVLTHCRLEIGVGELFVRVLFGGSAVKLLLPRSSNVFGHMTALKPNLMKALGVPTGAGKKLVHPLHAAVDRVLAKLTTANLSILRTFATLPPTIFAGRWSTVVSDPGRMTGFAQHGLRLESVLEASGGLVREVAGDDSDVLDTCWNISDSHAPDVIEARARFLSSVPPKYTEAWPSDLLVEHFPNLNFSHHADLLVAKVLLDLPVFVALMRDPGLAPEFEYEFPLLCVSPSVATTDDSTNQGKTMLAETLAKAIMPGVRTLKAKDSSSAPDQRTIAENLRLWGTLCLDEWQPPVSKSSILSRDNLQSLCTGGEVLSGRAMENISTSIRLRQSLVFSTKALDFGPDLINRGLFYYLDTLTEAQRARAVELDEIRSGRLSVRMRLGALALLESRGIWPDYQSMSRASSSALRFEAHKALAQAIYNERCRELGIPPVAGAIDAAVVEMRNRHKSHTREAEDSGLLTSLAEGKDISVRLSSLFHETTSADCQQMLDWVKARCSRPTTKSATLLYRISPTQLMRAWMAVRRFDEDTGLSAVVKYIRGTDPHCSDRSVAVAFSREIKELIPEGSCWSIPGADGWLIGRTKDHQRGIQLALIHRPAVAVVGPAVVGLTDAEKLDLGLIEAEK